MSWALVAWAWLKKWWKWLLPVVGAALWLLGKMGKKTIVVVSPELTQHEQVAADAEVKAKEAVTAAAAQRDAKIASVTHDYDDLIKKMDEANDRMVTQLENDPIELNRFLKETGKRADRS